MRQYVACDKREAFAQGSVSDEAIHSFLCVVRWIALASARNDVDRASRYAASESFGKLASTDRLRPPALAA